MSERQKDYTEPPRPNNRLFPRHAPEVERDLTSREKSNIQSIKDDLERAVARTGDPDSDDTEDGERLAIALSDKGRKA